MADEEDYRGEHQAPGRDYGAPMHDLSIGGIMPADLYENLHHYRFAHEATEDEAMGLIRHHRGHPDRLVSVFRAVPRGTPRGTTINPGDWVTPVKGYATAHGRSHLGGQFRVLFKKVPAKHLYTSGDDWREWGYDPSEG